MSESVRLAIVGHSGIVDNSCSGGGVGGAIAVGIVGEGLRFGSMGRLEFAPATWPNFNNKVTIASSIIANNTSSGGSGGGFAMAANTDAALTKGSVVSGNRVVNGSGGAVMLSDSASLQVDVSVVFDENSVTSGLWGVLCSCLAMPTCHYLHMAT